MQLIHAHPGTMSAATTGRTGTGRGRFDKRLTRRHLTHFVENPSIGGNNEMAIRQVSGRIDNLGCGTHNIRQGHNPCR